MEDLEEAITYHRQSLDLHSPNHSKRPAALSNLASAIQERFNQTGKMEDLEEAITYHRQLLDLCPPGHPDRAVILNNLGNSIWIRFEQTGKVEDLQESIVYHRQSLSFRPPGHPGRFMSLNNLGNAIFTCFKQTGKMDDLNEAIAYYHQSLDLCPSGHPDCSKSLNNLANAISTRFKQTGKMEDLEEAIARHRQSLDLYPPGHLNRSIPLSNLGNAILTRFQQTGKMVDLEEAIVCHRQSLDLRSPSHPNRSMSLNNLASAIFAYFEQIGKMDDLEESIAYHRQSLDLCPPGHPDCPTPLNNLANSIFTRFEQTGMMEDLEESIVFHQQSLDLRPPLHPGRSTSLNNLGNAIFTRFRQTGVVEDLEEAIAYHRQSLDLRPPGHSNRSISLSSLANSIWARFRQTGKMGDLEESIAYHRQSLDLRPSGHPDRSMSLNNMANAIWTRFEQKGKTELKDLEEAIIYHRQALDLRPLGHPHHSISLNNLGNVISTRFEQMGKMEDLEDAIAYHRKSLDLRPLGHPERAGSLSNLADAMLTHFTQTSKKGDLDYAAGYLFDAETNLPADHPMRTLIWAQLASVYLLQHDVTPMSQQISQAFGFFEHSANHHTASSKARFESALKWVAAAGRYRHESAVRAYSTLLTLLDRYLVATPTVESQQKFLASIAKSLASDAASSAIEAGQPETAVELLDRGRAIILSKARKYRHSLEKLRAVDPELADEFETLSVQLEHNAMSSESQWTGDIPSIPLEFRQRRHRLLSETWGGIVERIRHLDGFADFLQVVPFATLRKAAAEGPFIIVNISPCRSDAIIVRDSEPPVIVPLPNASHDDLTPLSSQFSNPRASTKQDFSKDLCRILQTLWRVIVGPVTEQLIALGVAKNTRIWWCPTSGSCALPLHAAGPYLKGEKCLPDLYISSYTSTLSALIAARSGVGPTTAPNLLVVADTGLPNAHIPNVEEELHRIQQLGDFVNILVGEAANRDNVISGLQQHSWAHFACHGHRNPEPFHSSFQLHAGEHLELLDLIKARLPNAEHAFLSACHAAAADIQGTPDEVLHLAGALQFCGFRSVVGTMWAMADIDGPDVAGDFYGYMFRDQKNVNFRDSAKALNRATREMRKRKTMTLGRWVNFIHIGA